MANSGNMKSDSPGAGPRLTDDIRKMIVYQLACFESPSSVQRWLRNEHGIQLDLSSIEYYQSSNKWADTFERFRAMYKADLEEVPIANRRYRLDRLQRRLDAIEHQYRRKERNPYADPAAFDEINKILEQARKETGEILTIKDESDRPLIIPSDLAEAMGFEYKAPEPKERAPM